MKLKTNYILSINSLNFGLTKLKKKHYIVGTKITEPFVIQNSCGEWSGISI